MQDNLDFLQYTKRYWDKYYPGGEYDALARRKGQGGPPAVGSHAPVSGAGARRAPVGAAPRTRTPNTGGGAASAALTAENNALKETVAGLERERDFYFSKLRDIELLIQQEMEANPELENNEDGILKRIQTILYSTEVRLLSHRVRSPLLTSLQEGFEIPAEAEGELAEEETF